MKLLLVGLTLLATTSAFAGDISCTTVFGQRVCAAVQTVGADVYIRNFQQYVPATKASAIVLCEQTGIDMSFTKVKFKAKKSENGEKVFSEVRCKHKEMQKINQWK